MDAESDRTWWFVLGSLYGVILGHAAAVLSIETFGSFNADVHRALAFASTMAGLTIGAGIAEVVKLPRFVDRAKWANCLWLLWPPLLVLYYTLVAPVVLHAK